MSNLRGGGGFYNEPVEQPGIAQIVQSKDSNGSYQTWHTTPERRQKYMKFDERMHEAFRFPNSVMGILSYSVLGLSLAALVGKVLNLVVYLISLGIVSDMAASFGLLILVLPIAATIIYVYHKTPQLRFPIMTRVTLFTLGVLLSWL